MEISHREQKADSGSVKTNPHRKSFITKGLTALKMVGRLCQYLDTRGAIGGPKNFLSEPSRKVPIVQEVDVLVVGGV